MSLTDPDAGTMSYAYDGLDRVITQTDAKGNITNNTYNAKNLLTQTETGGIITTHTYGTTNSNRYLLLSSVRGNCSISYTYDSLGRISTEQRKMTGGDTLLTLYSYNNIGQLVTKQYSGGPTVAYSYDAYGFIDEVWADSIFISKPHERTGTWTAVQCGENLFRDTWLQPDGRISELSLSGGNIQYDDNDIWYNYDNVHMQHK